MQIKSLLLGSAAVLVAANTARAADDIVAPEPEAVEYVRVCDAYGAGYFYIPGTETCLRIGGYLRYDVKGGKDAYSGNDRTGWDNDVRFVLNTYTATETELGALNTYTESRFEFHSPNARGDGYGGVGADHNSGSRIQIAYMQLGGFRVGLDESEFLTNTGYFGSVTNDNVIFGGSYRTGKISYTYTGNNGFSAVFALEQGGVNGDGFRNTHGHDYAINDYVPHMVGGLKYMGGWGKIAGSVAYDSVIEEWSAKVRGDVNITDRFSVWLQGAYSSEASPDQNYGQWGGDWAVWGGLQYKATDKATFNFQAAHDDWDKTAMAANIAYQLVPGLVVRPEVSYTRFGDSWRDYNLDNGVGRTNRDAWGGMVRFQRSF